ncbi:MAG: hypothetical protein LBR35_00250 [Rickettsiales bacterium]|nr:hypothetical protein [Rickettsiales bacterium]
MTRKKRETAVSPNKQESEEIKATLDALTKPERTSMSKIMEERKQRHKINSEVPAPVKAENDEMLDVAKSTLSSLDNKEEKNLLSTIFSGESLIAIVTILTAIFKNFFSALYYAINDLFSQKILTVFQRKKQESE